jgi:hypothetical protein
MTPSTHSKHFFPSSSFTSTKKKNEYLREASRLFEDRFSLTWRACAACVCVCEPCEPNRFVDNVFTHRYLARFWICVEHKVMEGTACSCITEPFFILLSRPPLVIYTHFVYRTKGYLFCFFFSGP